MAMLACKPRQPGSEVDAFISCWVQKLVVKMILIYNTCPHELLSKSLVFFSIPCFIKPEEKTSFIIIEIGILKSWVDPAVYLEGPSKELSCFSLATWSNLPNDKVTKFMLWDVTCIETSMDLFIFVIIYPNVLTCFYCLQWIMEFSPNRFLNNWIWT